MIFINQDSITTLDSLLMVNGNQSDVIDSLLQEIDVSETDQIDSLNELQSAIDSTSAVYASTKSTINSGLLLVKRIEILGSPYDSIYTDSATTWKVPLAYDKSFTQYEVSIDDFSEIIEFDFDNIQRIDEFRNVLVRAENIRVIEKSYTRIDSVKSNCDENCTDDEAIFTFYF